MAGYITLYPFAQGIGSTQNVVAPPIAFDSPIAHGGGSIADDSDASYMEIGGFRSLDDALHVEIVTADFKVPAGLTPLALVPKWRARTSPWAIANPPDLDLVRRMNFEYRDAATNAYIEHQGNFNSGQTVGLINAAEPDAKWFTTYYGASNDPDLSNPTEAGNWAELGDYRPEMRAALVGDGLRVAYFFHSEENARRPWVDLFELRLLVATEARPVTGLAPLRRDLCRDDSRVGRVWPQSSQQDSLRRLGGYY